MKDYNFCNNCGKLGHLFHQCKNPITSIGVIVYNNEVENDISKTKFLMIRRKDSLGYVDFMRGKYPLFNKRHIINILNEMTVKEREKILNNDFQELWDELWGDYVGIQYRGEERISKEKFNTIKSGITLANERYNLESLIEMCTNNWQEPEWGFPKGRRNYQEKDLACALREFEEETGCNKNDLKIIQNLLPIEELFTGSNYKSYKHKYYIANMNINDKPFSNYQKTEVSDIKWFTIDECKKKIRPYNYERIETVDRVKTILEKYKIINY